MVISQSQGPSTNERSLLTFFHWMPKIRIKIDKIITHLDQLSPQHHENQTHKKAQVLQFQLQGLDQG